MQISKNKKSYGQKAEDQKFGQTAEALNGMVMSSYKCRKHFKLLGKIEFEFDSY